MTATDPDRHTALPGPGLLIVQLQVKQATMMHCLNVAANVSRQVDEYL